MSLLKRPKVRFINLVLHANAKFALGHKNKVTLAENRGLRPNAEFECYWVVGTRYQMQLMISGCHGLEIIAPGIFPLFFIAILQEQLGSCFEFHNSLVPTQ